MIKSFGGEVNLLIERRGHDTADAVIELLCVFAQFVVVGQIIHNGIVANGRDVIQ